MTQAVNALWHISQCIIKPTQSNSALSYEAKHSNQSCRTNVTIPNNSNRSCHADEKLSMIFRYQATYIIQCNGYYQKCSNVKIIAVKLEVTLSTTRNSNKIHVDGYVLLDIKILYIILNLHRNKLLLPILLLFHWLHLSLQQLKCKILNSQHIKQIGV